MTNMSYSVDVNLTTYMYSSLPLPAVCFNYLILVTVKIREE